MHGFRSIGGESHYRENRPVGTDVSHSAVVKGRLMLFEVAIVAEIVQNRIGAVEHVEDDFSSIHDIPFGVFSTEGSSPRRGTAIGNRALALLKYSLHGHLNKTQVQHGISFEYLVQTVDATGRKTALWRVCRMVLPAKKST